MIDDVVLDHVAIAVEQWADAWPRFVTRLGGKWASGGYGPGFAPSQFDYANDFRLEVLAPHDVPVNDFLRRFLDRSGPGPHHLTFKVADLRAALVEVEAAGYRPVAVDFSDPTWLEAFIHPKDGPGVLVQLAQAGASWESHPPRDIPPPGEPRASLIHVAHGVASIGDALPLFTTLLGADRVATGNDDELDASWVELAWRGPGRVRLLQPHSPSSPVAMWMAGRAGRVHHLTFTVPGFDAPQELSPDDATGTRCRLLPG